MDSESGVETKVLDGETGLVGWLPVQSGLILSLYGAVWIELLYNWLAVPLQL